MQRFDTFTVCGQLQPCQMCFVHGKYYVLEIVSFPVIDSLKDLHNFGKSTISTGRIQIDDFPTSNFNGNNGRQFLMFLGYIYLLFDSHTEVFL